MDGNARPIEHWSLGGECLPLREIGEAEIFEYCGPGLGPELELFFFLFFFFWAAGNHVAMAMAMAWPWPNWGMICVL
jgi:hypothetical protein